VPDTGAPVSVPVGEPVLGRVFNLLGEPIDEQGPEGTDKRSPIHRDPPEFVDLNPKTEILPPASRSSTCSARSSAAARSASSAVPASARPSSSRR
jgi:vacuolar-type H+-ATPase subunit B/Vma2